MATVTNSNPICMITLCLALACAGCHQESPERKGDLEARAGRYESAIYWYEGALGGGDRAAIHLKMAEIFANKLKDSSSAAYHYKRILALRAGSQASEKARAALETRLRRSRGSFIRRQVVGRIYLMQIKIRFPTPTNSNRARQLSSLDSA
jgi:hypothetical protein